MIKAVSFDFYNTLVRFWPPLEEIQQAACHELGLKVREEAITQGYAVADVLFNRENETRGVKLLRRTATCNHGGICGRVVSTFSADPYDRSSRPAGTVGTQFHRPACSVVAST